MNAPKRISIKLFIDNPETLRAAQVVPIFQRWIQRNRLEGLLIDVADYQHVHRGPGIVLIGHEGDYGYDPRAERPGIQYTLKHAEGLSLAEALAITLRRVLQAASLFEREKSLKGVQVNADELLITFRDRLNFPNRSETWLELIPEVQAVAGDVYSAGLSLKALEGDAREPLQIRVSSSEPVSIETLLEAFAVRQ